MIGILHVLAGQLAVFLLAGVFGFGFGGHASRILLVIDLWMGELGSLAKPPEQVNETGTT